MLHEIDSLREIARRCLDGQPLEDHHSKWLGRSLDKFLNQSCRTIEEAFDLHMPKGGIPWWREEAIRKRDRALLELAGNYCDNLSASACAKHISTLSLRYPASAWRFDKTRRAMPSHYRSQPPEYLWRAFQSGATMPLCERQLRSILAGVHDRRTKPMPYGLNPAQARAR